MQKALVRTFMGGLRTKILNEIFMFQPQTLNDVIRFARMRDDQLVRQRRFTQPVPPVRAPLALPSANRVVVIAPVALVWRLSWEEMQCRRLQGLCFNCNECFTAGHKCQGPRILMLDRHVDGNNVIYDDVTKEQHAKEN